MITHFIEATNGPCNWGKFMVARFTPEQWAARSFISAGEGLLRGRGWTPDHVLVLDLQTGEGAMLLPGGCAAADLHKRRIWVCPLFEPFLEWLYQQDLRDLAQLPAHIDLPEAPFELRGYRRAGLDVAAVTATIAQRLAPDGDEAARYEATAKAEFIVAYVLDAAGIDPA